MDKKIVTTVILILLGTVGVCWAGCCRKGLRSQCQRPAELDPVEKILGQLRQKAQELKSYQCHLEFEVNQPWFETKTLRKGILYYAKFGKKSKLRINFRTLKQDDEKEQKYIKHFIFDGIWLTHIDYQIKQVKIDQLAEANEPVDAFDLVKLQKGEAEKFVQLHLKVKPDSVYKDDYTFVDFWIDKKLHLPAKVVAVTTEEDIYEIKFLKSKVNKKLDEKVFDFRIPKGFGKEITPLKKKSKPQRDK
jgi:outer membrane lipoprotein-sorting protein